MNLHIWAALPLFRQALNNQVQHGTDQSGKTEFKNTVIKLNAKLVNADLTQQLSSQGLLFLYLSPSFSRPRVIHTSPAETTKAKVFLC